MLVMFDYINVSVVNTCAQGGDLSDSQRQAEATRRFGDVMTQRFGKLEITPSGSAEASRLIHLYLSHQQYPVPD